MSFNNFSNSYNNISNIINQLPDDNITPDDIFIISSNASLVDPTENNNIQNEDGILLLVGNEGDIPLLVEDEDNMPPLVEDEDDMPPLIEDTSSSTIDDYSPLILISSVGRGVGWYRTEAMIQQYIAEIAERETRKFNIATHVREENAEQVEIECNICYELNNNKNFIKLNCNHEFCKECIKNILKSCQTNFNEPCCAYCREKINAITYKNETIHEEFSNLIATTSMN